LLDRAQATGGLEMAVSSVKGLKGLGIAGAIVGTGLDVYGVSTAKILPGKAMENGVFTAIGLKGGWPGALISVAYFGLEAYYTGGANQATADYSSAWSQHAQSWKQIKMESGGL